MFLDADNLTTKGENANTGLFIGRLTPAAACWKFIVKIEEPPPPATNTIQPPKYIHADRERSYHIVEMS